METTWRSVAVTAIAPVAWGASYVVTRELLPPGHPLWGAVLRAVPAGILLCAVSRRRPSGSWWWRSVVLGTLTIGGFFVLVYVAATTLPSSVASTLMAVSPAALMLLAWPLLAQRPRTTQLVGAALGFIGVCAMLLTGVGGLNPVGVLASLAAMTTSSVGFILSVRWRGDQDVLSMTAWQLVAGGLVVVPVAALVEGAPPHLDGREIAGFAYLTVVATAIAYVAWFSGLARLDAGAVGLIGLLNPVTGVILGTVIAAETLTGLQLAGLALVLVGILLGQPSAVRMAGWLSRHGYLLSARLRGGGRGPADEPARVRPRVDHRLLADPLPPRETPCIEG